MISAMGNQPETIATMRARVEERKGGACALAALLPNCIHISGEAESHPT